MATIYRRKRRDGTREENYTARIWVNGRKFSRSTGAATEQAARQAVPALRAEIEKALEDQAEDRLTLTTLFGKWWSDHGNQLATADTVQARIKNLLAILPPNMWLADLCNKDIADYIVTRSKDRVSPTTINRELEVLRAAYRMAQNRWEHPVRPIRWVDHMAPEPDERVSYLTLEEAQAMVAALPIHIADSVEFSIYTGARLNELATLVWKAVKWSERICIVQTKRKAGQIVRWRNLYLSADALGILKKLMPRDRGAEQGFVFDLTSRRKHWLKARAVIGRPELRWHDLRHTHGTWMRQNRNDLKLIQRSLGHRHIQTTMKYAHVDDWEVKQAVDGLQSIRDGRKDPS